MIRFFSLYLILKTQGDNYDDEPSYIKEIYGWKLPD